MALVAFPDEGGGGRYEDGETVLVMRTLSLIRLPVRPMTGRTELVAFVLCLEWSAKHNANVWRSGDYVLLCLDEHSLVLACPFYIHHIRVRRYANSVFYRPVAWQGVLASIPIHLQWAPPALAGFVDGQTHYLRLDRMVVSAGLATSSMVDALGHPPHSAPLPGISSLAPIPRFPSVDALRTFQADHAALLGTCRCRIPVGPAAMAATTVAIDAGRFLAAVESRQMPHLFVAAAVPALFELLRTGRLTWAAAATLYGRPLVAPMLVALLDPSTQLLLSQPLDLLQRPRDFLGRTIATAPSASPMGNALPLRPTAAFADDPLLFAYVLDVRRRRAECPLLYQTIVESCSAVLGAMLTYAALYEQLIPARAHRLRPRLRFDMPTLGDHCRFAPPRDLAAVQALIAAAGAQLVADEPPGVLDMLVHDPAATRAASQHLLGLMRALHVRVQDVGVDDWLASTGPPEEEVRRLLQQHATTSVLVYPAQRGSAPSVSPLLHVISDATVDRLANGWDAAMAAIRFTHIVVIDAHAYSVRQLVQLFVNIGRLRAVNDTHIDATSTTLLGCRWANGPFLTTDRPADAAFRLLLPATPATMRLPSAVVHRLRAHLTTPDRRARIRVIVENDLQHALQPTDLVVYPLALWHQISARRLANCVAAPYLACTPTVGPGTVHTMAAKLRAMAVDELVALIAWLDADAGRRLIIRTPPSHGRADAVSADGLGHVLACLTDAMHSNYL